MVMLIKPFQGMVRAESLTTRNVDRESCCQRGRPPGGPQRPGARDRLPPAYKMLTSFADLKAGDVVLQNDACSPIGRCVVQLCKARGIKTVNIVKDW